MIRVLISILALVGAFVWVDPVRSDSWITQTDCDTLSLQPFRVSIEFQVRNGGAGLLEDFQLIPLPSQAAGCVVEDCGVPNGWLWILHTYNDIVDFYSPPPHLPIDGVASPFRIVIRTVPCSYEVHYFAGGMPYADETVTFTSSGAVPTLPGTWGKLKAHYR